MVQAGGTPPAALRTASTPPRYPSALSSPRPASSPRESREGAPPPQLPYLRPRPGKLIHTCSLSLYMLKSILLREKIEHLPSLALLYRIVMYQGSAEHAAQDGQPQLASAY